MGTYDDLERGKEGSDGDDQHALETRFRGISACSP